MSVLVISEIVVVFVNTVTADGKYSLHNRKNLLEPLQLRLSKKQKYFFSFAAYLKATSNFEDFEKKDEPHWLCIFEIRNCEGRG